MISAGDVAVARGDWILFSDFKILSNKPWCFNFEGIIENSSFLFELLWAVRYGQSELIADMDFSLKPVFEGFDDKAYLEWFKENRIKRRGLPIYKSSHASITNSMRDYWVAVRQHLIDTAARVGIKKMSRRS